MTTSHHDAMRGDLELDHDDWDTHWDDYAPVAKFSPAQIYRRWLTLRLIDRRCAPQRLVDFGSGTGDLLEDASRRWPSAELLGLELSASGVRYAADKVPDAEFVQANLERDRAQDGRYAGWATHAVCSEVLEHVDDPVALLRNARTYLATGSRLVVTVPGGTMSAFDRHIGHRRHYTPELLEQTFTDAGLVTAMVGGAGFPFFNLYRWFVIRRGEKVVEDVFAGGGTLSLPARLAMFAFRPLLAVSLPRSRWGKQIFGVAYEPGQSQTASDDALSQSAAESDRVA